MVMGKGSENEDKGNNVAPKRPILRCQNLLVAPQSEGHQAMSAESLQSLPETFEVLEAGG